MVHMSPGFFSRKRDAREPVFLQASSVHSGTDEVASDTELPLELAARPKFVSGSGADCAKNGRVAARQATTTALGSNASKVAELVKEFCSKNPPCRVAPTEEDLERFWSQCQAAQPSSASTAALAGFEHGLANALVEQLQDTECTHEWKPQLRALCTLTFLHRSGDQERRIAEVVTSKAGGILRHLAAEVPACKNEANKVIILSKFVGELPAGQGLRVDEEGGVFFTSTAISKKKPASAEVMQKRCSPSTVESDLELELEMENSTVLADIRKQQFSRDATDVETSGTQEDPFTPKKTRQMSRCQSAPGLSTLSEKSASATMSAEAPEPRAPAGTFLGAQLFKLYALQQSSPEDDAKLDEQAVPQDEGRSLFWGLWRRGATSSSSSAVEPLCESLPAEATSHTLQPPAVAADVSPACSRSSEEEAQAAASNADSSAEPKQEQQESANAGVQPPADSSPPPLGSAVAMRPTDFELDDSMESLLDADVEEKAERPKEAELTSGAFSPPMTPPSHAKPLAEIRIAPPPQPAAEMRLATPVNSTSDVDGALSTPDAAAASPINAVALSTPDAAAAKATCVSSKPEAAGLDDSFDLALEVAVEKVGLPGALGLAASQVRGSPPADNDQSTGSGKRQVPYIPWGIELTLPQAPQDPFVNLVDKSL